MVDQSSAEAKLMGIVKGITEILWLKNFLCGLNFPQKEACKLFCDNQTH